MVGGNLYLKKEAIPHKFACQPGRNLTEKKKRPSAVKRHHALHLKEALTVEEEVCLDAMYRFGYMNNCYLDVLLKTL